MIYISFSVLARTLTNLGLGSRRGGLSSRLPSETSMVGNFPSEFFIRRFYNTFIKNSDIYMRSNMFTDFFK